MRELLPLNLFARLPHLRGDPGQTECPGSDPPKTTPAIHARNITKLNRFFTPISISPGTYGTLIVALVERFGDSGQLPRR